MKPGHFSPVRDAPEGFEVVRSLVLVLEVVGVFPHIDTEDGRAFAASDGLAHDRVVLIGGGNDLELAAIDDEPGPAAAETADTRGFKLRLEIRETAERGIDALRDCAGGRAAGLGSHELPEHRVIVVTAAVVADGAADIVRHRGEIADERVDGLGFQRGIAGEGLVQIIHVSLVMAAVVDLHRLLVDVRFERVVRVGKAGEFVWHDSYLCVG